MTQSGPSPHNFAVRALTHYELGLLRDWLNENHKDYQADARLKDLNDPRLIPWRDEAEIGDGSVFIPGWQTVDGDSITWLALYAED